MGLLKKKEMQIPRELWKSGSEVREKLVKHDGSTVAQTGGPALSPCHFLCFYLNAGLLHLGIGQERDLSV